VYRYIIFNFVPRFMFSIDNILSSVNCNSYNI